MRIYFNNYLFIGTNIELYRSLTLDHLFDFRKQCSHPTEIHFIASNTGETFDNIVHQQNYPILIHLSRISELQKLSEQSNGLTIGSCITLSQLKFHFSFKQEHQRVYRIFHEQLDFN